VGRLIPIGHSGGGPKGVRTGTGIALTMAAIHCKKTITSTYCGRNIFGKLTDAEGHKVTCPECLDRMKEKHA